MHKIVKFEKLRGKILTKIKVSRKYDEITFYCSNGKVYLQNHLQDSCEDVRIEDITGSLDDLLNSEILFATESTNINKSINESIRESGTWTFYKLATIKGWVDIRWYGTSNGYYSEEANFIRIK